MSLVAALQYLRRDQPVKVVGGLRGAPSPRVRPVPGDGGDRDRGVRREDGEPEQRRTQHVRPLADRHPVHAVREPAADAVVGWPARRRAPTCRCRRSRVGHAGGLAGQADGAARRRADDGFDQPVQLVAHHVARRQRRHAGERPGDLALGYIGDPPSTGRDGFGLRATARSRREGCGSVKLWRAAGRSGRAGARLRVRAGSGEAGDGGAAPRAGPLRPRAGSGVTV